MTSQNDFVDGGACAQSTPIQGPHTDQLINTDGMTVISEHIEVDYQAIVDGMMRVLNDFFLPNSIGDYVEVLSSSTEDHLRYLRNSRHHHVGDIIDDALKMQGISAFITRMAEQHQWTEDYLKRSKINRS